MKELIVVLFIFLAIRDKGGKKDKRNPELYKKDKKRGSNIGHSTPNKNQIKKKSSSQNSIYKLKSHLEGQQKIADLLSQKLILNLSKELEEILIFFQEIVQRYKSEEIDQAAIIKGAVIYLNAIYALTHSQKELMANENIANFSMKCSFCEESIMIKNLLRHFRDRCDSPDFLDAEIKEGVREALER